jgi:hypothetical protein
VLALAAVMAAGWGCGDHRSPAGATLGTQTVTSKPGATAADRSLAERANLHIGDFPPGWREETSPGTPDTCPDYVATRRTALARHVSPTFRRGNNTFATSVVLVFSNSEEATRRVDALGSQSHLNCERELYRRPFKSSDAVVGDFQAGRVSSERFGDQTVAFEIAGSVKTQSPVTGDYVDVGVFVDSYAVRRGRAVARVDFIDVISAFDEQLRASLTHRVVDRLRSAELDDTGRNASPRVS